MKFLFIEDDSEKRRRISEFLRLEMPDVEIDHKGSLHGGLKALVSESDYDCVLLDMTLPNFELSAEDPDGGTPESFAGRDILSQMKLRGLTIPVIVITMFDIFGENELTLSELKEELSTSYGDVYIATIYFSITSDDWKKDLISAISRLGL